MSFRDIQCQDWPAEIVTEEGCSKRQPEERVLSVATLKRGDCRGDGIAGEGEEEA
jgi:hypothetical protein